MSPSEDLLNPHERDEVGLAGASSPRSGSGHSRWSPPEVGELGDQIHGYEIRSLIGRGGMGAVYLGFQTSLSRKVAIKILPPDVERDFPGYTDRFRNEARLMASVSHPCIVTVFDFGQTEAGLLYFVMEYIEGMDILQKIRASPARRLAPETARDIAIQVCDALRFAHAKEVIHRDIKPANVLLDQEGQVKVADFGLAKWNAGEIGADLTLSGMAMGTPGYMAPEALQEGGVVDHRADLYAVGAMLFQMLTGRPPQGWLQNPSGEVPGLSAEFDRILKRALEPNPELRFQSAGELRADLVAIAGGTVNAEIDTNAETIPVARGSTAVEIRGQSGAGWAWLGWAIFGLAAAIFVFWLGFRGERPTVLQESGASGVGISPHALPLVTPSRRVEGEAPFVSPLPSPPRRVED